MAKKSGLQNFIGNAVNLINGIIKKLRKMDRRQLLMIAAAFVLLIIILILIVHGVKAGKKDKDDVPPPPPVSTDNEEPSTDEEPAVIQLNGAGKYKVNTGSDSDLNMRIAADRNSDLMGRIPNGTDIEVLFVDDSGVVSDTDYGWGYVEYNGHRGWVFMEYLVPSN